MRVIYKNLSSQDGALLLAHLVAQVQRKRTCLERITNICGKCLQVLERGGLEQWDLLT